jgi:hypothetical protein
MSKNYLEGVSKMAVFRNVETPFGTPEEGGGVSMVFDSGSFLTMERTTEDDRDFITGADMPTEVNLAMQRASATLTQSRAKPDFITMILAYFFGEVATTAAGATGYKHTISPKKSTPEMDGFSVVQQRGDVIFKERFAGNTIDGFSIELGESWTTASADVVGSGRYETTYTQEVVAAQEDSTQLTLDANAVEGADAAERLENVFRVRAHEIGEDKWTVADITAVSADTPAVIDIGAIGTNATNVDFYIDYVPDEPSWGTMPAKIDESPLKLSDAKVVIDGFFDGTDILGGEVICADQLAFTVTGANSVEIRQVPCQTGVYYGEIAERGGSRVLTIALTEKLKNSIRQYQAMYPDTRTISLYLHIKGAEIDVGSGFYYGLEMIFPKVAILNEPISISGKMLAQ